MSALVRIRITEDGGEVLHDETNLIDVDRLEGFSKRGSVLGVGHTIEISFDPPLIVPRGAPEGS